MNNIYAKLIEKRGEEWNIWTDNENSVKVKPNKVVVKLKNKDNSFKKSVIVPTVMYPLNNCNEFKVFDYRNTEYIDDEKIKKAFNETNYKVGCCYHNSLALIENLVKQNINRADIKCFVGWLFMSPFDFPVHHCWLVYKETMILDLSDNYYLYELNRDKIDNANDINEARHNLAEFTNDISKLPNAERCFPLGQVTPNMLYVGSECDALEGVRIYQKLIKDFPNHDCHKGCDAKGLNPTQRIMKQKGYI